MFVCLNINNDEYGGIGLTFSTIFNSDKRRGLKWRIYLLFLNFNSNLAVVRSPSSCSMTWSSLRPSSISLSSSCSGLFISFSSNGLSSVPSRSFSSRLK